MENPFYAEMKRRVEAAKNSEIKELADFAVVVDGLCASVYGLRYLNAPEPAQGKDTP